MEFLCFTDSIQKLTAKIDPVSIVCTYRRSTPIEVTEESKPAQEYLLDMLYSQDTEFCSFQANNYQCLPRITVLVQLVVVTQELGGPLYSLCGLFPM